MVLYTIPSTVGYWDTYKGRIEHDTTLALLQMIADAYDAGADTAPRPSSTHETGDKHQRRHSVPQLPNEPQRQVRRYLEQRNLLLPLPPPPPPIPSTSSVSRDKLMDHSEYNDSQVTLRPPPTVNKRWRVKVKGLLIPHVNTSPKSVRSAPTSPVAGSSTSRWRLSRDMTSKRKSLAVTQPINTALPISSASSGEGFDFFGTSTNAPADKDVQYDTPPSSPDLPNSTPISPPSKRRPLKVSTTIVLRREVERSKTPITPSRSATARKQRKSILLPDEDIWVKAMSPVSPTAASPMTLATRSSANIGHGVSVKDTIMAVAQLELDRPIQPGHVAAARQQVSLWTLLFLTGAGYLLAAMLVTLCVLVGVYRGANRGAGELVKRVRAYRDSKVVVESIDG